MSDPQIITLPALRMADGGTFTGTLTFTGVVTPPATSTPPVVTPPAPDPAPVPVPTVPPPHGQRRMLWHHGWNGPALSKLPADVRGRLTGVLLAISQSAHAGSGQLADPPGVSAQDVHALVADGIDVFTGVGGSNDGGITIVTTAQADEAVASAVAQQKRLGITGICWDLEGTSWQVDALTSASRKILDAGLKVGIWSGTWGGRLESFGAVAQALGDRLDHWQRALYDFPEANDGQLTGIVTRAFDGLPALRKYLTRDDQLVCSFAPVGAMSRTPVDVMAAAYAAGRKLYPTAGYSVWEDYQDSAAGWTSSRALAKV